ncbi:MAG: phosphoribosylformylglycinamidine cyclo-ligase [Oscillospiraceae bacterium]|jgi:phosphoribosylformylglycinamidine cyclo-ligase|nr:phosphoribosylformylglycinamidine cyclo-ligase [Oscillospiraceae bacterium]
MQNNSYTESYKNAGVDVTAGYRAVELIKSHAARTITPGVLSGLGGFGGLYAPNLAGIEEPVLVSGADGVGTKLRLAFLLNRHDTVGIDCVAMCVNDIICSGASPMFFLDYLAVGKNVPERIEKIVSGVAEGCVQAGCALIGGETAEMPGFYAHDEYDLAGFSVGIVDKSRMLAPENVKAGDVILALPSSGLHSNGFSLVRKVFEVEKGGLGRIYPELGSTLGEALLTPTRIYVKQVLAMARAVRLNGLCNITGGGFYENIPRARPEGLTARVDKPSLRVPPIFGLIAQTGKIPVRDMFSTFNMGVGMCAFVPEEDAGKAIRVLTEEGVDAYAMGVVKEGERGVEIV